MVGMCGVSVESRWEVKRLLELILRPVIRSVMPVHHEEETQTLAEVNQHCSAESWSFCSQESSCLVDWSRILCLMIPSPSNPVSVQITRN